MKQRSAKPEQQRQVSRCHTRRQAIPMAETPPKDYDALSAAITARYGTLSKRLRQIANYALDHPTDMAIETIAVIARRAEVQPSALIRFAKSFDYTGFSQMQRAFKTRIAERSASYKERVRAARTGENNDDLGVEQSLLNQLCATNIISLTELSEGDIHRKLALAADLLEAAETVYVVGHRRSFPVAAYIAYTLSHAESRTQLLDGIGGMLTEEAQFMCDKDVLVAISYSEYARETVEVVSLASQQGVPVIVISDSPLSPIVPAARVFLEVLDAEVLSFRSLTASMCIGQTLAMSLAFRASKKN